MNPGEREPAGVSGHPRGDLPHRRYPLRTELTGISRDHPSAGRAAPNERCPARRRVVATPTSRCLSGWSGPCRSLFLTTDFFSRTHDCARDTDPRIV